MIACAYRRCTADARLPDTPLSLFVAPITSMQRRGIRARILASQVRSAAARSLGWIDVATWSNTSLGQLIAALELPEDRWNPARTFLEAYIIVRPCARRWWGCKMLSRACHTAQTCAKYG